MFQFPDTQLFQLVVLPLIVFASRLVDVSLGTLRILFVSRSRAVLAAAVGFFEVLIWLVVITQVLSNLHSWIHFVAYAAGFAVGNYLGIRLEGWLQMGTIILRVITHRQAEPLVETLRAAGCGVTTVQGEGMEGPVQLVFTVLRRRQLPEVLAQVKRFHPNAFSTVEHVHSADHGFFPPLPQRHLFPAVAAGRKGK